MATKLENNKLTLNDKIIDASGTAIKIPGSVAEGVNTTAAGGCSHAEGSGSSVGQYTRYGHAEGDKCKVLNLDDTNSSKVIYGAHAEGSETIAKHTGAHAEGMLCEAHGEASHAEGNSTKAFGANSHAEGNGNKVFANNAHVEGKVNTIEAAAEGAHVEGTGNTAKLAFQHVVGTYNDPEKLADCMECVGAGWWDSSIGKPVYNTIRSVDKSGNETLKGELFCKGLRVHNGNLQVTGIGGNSQYAFMDYFEVFQGYYLFFVRDLGLKTGGNKYFLPPELSHLQFTSHSFAFANVYDYMNDPIGSVACTLINGDPKPHIHVFYTGNSWWAPSGNDSYFMSAMVFSKMEPLA